MDEMKVAALKDLLKQVQGIIGENEEGPGEDGSAEHERAELPELEKSESEMGDKDVLEDSEPMPEDPETDRKAEVDPSLMDYFRGKKPSSAPDRKGMRMGAAPVAKISVAIGKKPKL